jgi:phage regulator Rha-like protein
MELAKISASQTMSSREIAELTGKRHDHVLADIRKTLEEAEIEATEFLGAYKMPSGQTATVYNLPRRECDLVVQ